jgi:predicted nuclease of predicted toxin-antitoxin system
MRWLVDECVDAELVRQLRHRGHDVVYVAADGSGSTDPQVVLRAREEDRVLLTEDKDFGDLVFRFRLALPGVVFLRILPEDRAIKWDRLSAAIEQFGTGLIGRYVVVEKSRMRSRPLLFTL